MLTDSVQKEIIKIQTNLRNGLNIRNQTSTNRNFFARVLSSAIAPVLWLWRLFVIPKNPILERLSEEEEKIVKFTQLIFESLLHIGKLLDKKRLPDNPDSNSSHLNGVANILREQPYHRIFDILLLQLNLRKSIGNTECVKDANSVNQINEVQAYRVAATHELPYETVVLLCLLMESLKEVMKKKEKEDKQSEDIQGVSEATPLLNNFNDEAIRNGVNAFLWNCRELVQPWMTVLADSVTSIFGGSCCFQVLSGLDSLIPNTYLRVLLASQSFSANTKVYCGSTRALFLGIGRLFPGDSILPFLSAHIDERWIRRSPNKYVLIPAFIISAAISVAYAFLAVKGIKDSEGNVASWGDYSQDVPFFTVTVICMTGVQTKSIVDKLQTYFSDRKLNKVNQQSALEVLPSHDHSSRSIKCVTTLTRMTVFIPIVGVDAMMVAGYSQLVKKVPHTLAIGASISLPMSPFNYYNMKNFWIFVAQHIESCKRNLGHCDKGSVHYKEGVGLKTRCLNNVSSLYDFIVLWVINPFNNAAIAVLSKEVFIELINRIKQMSPHTEHVVGKSIKIVLFITGFSTSEMFSMCPYDREHTMLKGFKSCCDAVAELQRDQVMPGTLRRNGDTDEYPSSPSQSSDVSINVAQDKKPQPEAQTKSWGGWFKSWCPCFWRSEEGKPLLTPGDSSVQSEESRDLVYGACQL